jgi:hypothetical protein
MKVAVYYTTNELIPWYKETLDVPEEISTDPVALKPFLQEQITGAMLDGKQITVRSIFMVNLINTECDDLPTIQEALA